MYKLYAIVSKEALKKMNGVRGKLCVQTGHAFLHSIWDAEESFPCDAYAYKTSRHAFKITLVVDTDAELEYFYEKFKDMYPCAKIVDKGFTVFKEPTLTCLGFGPVHENNVPDEIKSLKLLC